jgi:hypothetical protein
MLEVTSARAAVDAHAGVAGVAQAWLQFLSSVAIEEANKVRCRMEDGWCSGLFGTTTCTGLEQTP